MHLFKTYSVRFSKKYYLFSVTQLLFLLNFSNCFFGGLNLTTNMEKRAWNLKFQARFLGDLLNITPTQQLQVAWP